MSLSGRSTAPPVSSLIPEPLARRQVWDAVITYKLVNIQKDVRVITSPSLLGVTGLLYKILTIDDQYKYNVILFMYKFFNKLLPSLDIFTNMFVTNVATSLTNPHSTRQSITNCML